MSGTKLVLVEGIPGAGKSSTCQLLRRSLAAAGRPAVWWHEEQRGHPVYMFGDGPSIQATLAELGAGRHVEVAERALAWWAAFVEEAGRGGEVVLVDSCLYITRSFEVMCRPTVRGTVFSVGTIRPSST